MLPIEMMPEEAQESPNKIYRQKRERESITHERGPEKIQPSDLIRRILLLSDPVISTLRSAKLMKKKTDPPEDVIHQQSVVSYESDGEDEDNLCSDVLNFD